MASKYGIYGAAYNGDGTASNEAASDGAAGAWKLDQAAGDILHGTAPTYGTLAAGDTVYVRSKTGNGADANKTFSLTTTTATIGSANATEANPITWILDNGVTWSGQNGVLEWDTSNTTINPVVLIRNYNNFVALEPDAFFVDYNVVDPNVRRMIDVGTGCWLKNWKLDNNEKTGWYDLKMLYMGSCIVENAHVIAGRLAPEILIVAPGAHAVLISPTVELVYTTTPSANSSAVFSTVQSSNRGGKLTVYGGTITGAAADDGYASLASVGASVWTADLEFYGTNFPKQMPLALTPSAWAQYYPQRIFCIGADSGYGSAVAEPWGTLDSRNMTYNYPVLNATMPDSGATPWSWRLYAPYAKRATPASLKIGKLYSSAAATKTVTLEILAATTWTAALLDKANVWMTVAYVKDSDGSVVTESTRTTLRGTGLDSSTASWDTTAWGAVSCNKKKLSLTTANSIKQDTMVVVTLHWTSAAGSTNEQVFICPDVQLT